MRSWAAIDEAAAKAVRMVYKMRLEYVGSIFAELGLSQADADMRTKMFVCYFSMSPLMFPGGSRSKREELMKKQLDWFCKK